MRAGLARAVEALSTWQAARRSDETRELLAGIYDWFTEGFDTADPVTARALCG